MKMKCYTRADLGNMKDLRLFATQHRPKANWQDLKKTPQHNVKDIWKFIVEFYALLSEIRSSSLSQEKGQLLR